MPVSGSERIDGNDGWSPEYAVASDGARRVLKIVDWTGGEGTKPAVDKYVGASGLVDAVGDGVDIRGAAGAAGATGSAGTNGSTWHTGTSAPGNGTGSNGDYYFRSTTGDVYLKTSGAWNTPIANLTGPDGPTGQEYYPGVAFVRESGNDDTAEVGRPGAAFATIDAAISALSGLGVNGVIDLGEGDWTCPASGVVTGRMHFRGHGVNLCSLTITPQNENISIYDAARESFVLNLDMTGDFTAAVRSLTVTRCYCGTLDASGAAGEAETDGQAGGNLTFIDCSIGELPDVSGGDGGDGAAGSVGNGGDAGDVIYHGCKFRGVDTTPNTETANSYGGPESAAGGDGGDCTSGDGDGGDGGDGGTITRRHCWTRVSGSFSTASGVAGGAGGAGNGSGSTGSAGTGGSVINQGFNTGSAFAFATHS